MNYIADAKEMKEIEKHTIDDIGISSLVLMERAALSVSEEILKRFSKKSRICVVCGVGNNGADGVAIGRQLLEKEYKVDIVVLGNREKYSKEMTTQLAVISKMKISCLDKIPNKDYDCFVDAIFGIGLAREITDRDFREAIDTINSSDAYIYSVDIPTGIHTDTGKVMGNAIKANETITFTCEKTGLCLYPGKEYAGKVTIKEIGISKKIVQKFPTMHFCIYKDEKIEFLDRAGDSNKGTFGKVLIIAGNSEISGAAIMCATASFKSGAGMVKVLAEEENLDIIKKTLPEAMVQSLSNVQDMEEIINNNLKWADSVVIGPGIGMNDNAYNKLFNTLKNFPADKKLVIDADGINLIAKYDELKMLTNKMNNVIYTPHMMELERLLEKDRVFLKDNLDVVMTEAIKDNRAVYVCKDSVTRVYKNEKPIYINRYGNSGMATAGSGDVLAGIIGALVARKNADIFDVAVLGVFLHSLAGDLAARNLGENSLMAGDIINSLPAIFKDMEDVN